MPSSWTWEDATGAEAPPKSWTWDDATETKPIPFAPYAGAGEYADVPTVLRAANQLPANATKKQRLQAELEDARDELGPLTRLFAGPRLVPPPSPEEAAAYASPIGYPLRVYRTPTVEPPVVQTIREAGRGVGEMASSMTEPEMLPLAPLAAVPLPGGPVLRHAIPKAMGLLFGGQAAGTGAGEIVAGIEQGDPRLIGRGIPPLVAGAGMIAPSVAPGPAAPPAPTMLRPEPLLRGRTTIADVLGRRGAMAEARLAGVPKPDVVVRPETPPAPAVEPLTPAEQAQAQQQLVEEVPAAQPPEPPAAPAAGAPPTLDPVGNPADFYSLPKLRAANARNDPQVAAAKKYYGSKSVPELAKLAQARFAEMAAKAVPAAQPVEAPVPAEAPAELYRRRTALVKETGNEMDAATITREEAERLGHPEYEGQVPYDATQTKARQELQEVNAELSDYEATRLRRELGREPTPQEMERALAQGEQAATPAEAPAPAPTARKAKPAYATPEFVNEWSSRVPEWKPEALEKDLKRARTEGLQSKLPGALDTGWASGEADALIRGDIKGGYLKDWVEHQDRVAKMAYSIERYFGTKWERAGDRERVAALKRFLSQNIDVQSEVVAPKQSATPAPEAPKPAPAEANVAKIADLNRQLAKEQKALDKNVAKMGTMVPPPIVAEITRKIATRMAKIQDQIDALEKPAPAPVAKPATMTGAGKVAKPTAQMTAGEINRELDKLSQQSEKVTDQMIAAGRGAERPSDYLRKTDPLSVQARNVSQRISDLQDEIGLRYGPNAPSRLPIQRGFFGPRAKPEPPAPPAGAAPGPGAASPSEFAERAAKGAAGAPPPPPAAPVTLDASAKPVPEVARRAKDFNIFNNVNSGQWTFYFGKLGAAAKAAWEKMALSGFRIRENTGRDVKQYVDGLLASLPRDIRRKGGTAFFEALDGRDMEQIEAEWAGKPGGDQVIAGARAVKGYLENVRTTIRDAKREAYNAFLMGLDRDTLSQLFDRNMGAAREIDTTKYTKSQFADALTRADLPDDWGIADGSYMPHIFYGDWKLTLAQDGKNEFVTRAKTVAEAKARVFQMTKDNPALADAQWKIEPDATIPADLIRLGDRQFWRLIEQMKEKLTVTSAEVREAQQGVIGRKAAKQKWWGNLQKREGFGGYSRDYGRVMRSYISGFHRWVELSRLNREVQPLIEQVKGGTRDEAGNIIEGGRPQAAEALTDILDHLWGKPAKSSVLFDNFVRQIPYLRDYVKPLLLDRISRNIRSAIAYGTLTTARFAVVNRLQPFQGLYPLVGERILAQAKIMQHTAEGRALLDRAGVRFDPGQYGESTGMVGRTRRAQQWISGEGSNQQLAFLAMYQHGRESGLGDAASINYAKLRGQLLTQFTPNPADVPPVMRGPLTGLLFQFKRFPLKQGELLFKMASNGQVAGLARWFGVMAATGGLSYFMRQFLTPSDTKERLRRAITREHGDKVADVAMYGLPGALNVDLSGSLVLGDEPFGDNFYEKLGRQVVGPTASLAYETGKALGTATRQPSTIPQQIITQMRRIPSLRQIAEVAALLQGDYDVRSPDGEVKYRKSLKDALMGVGAFRTANEANMQLAVSAIVELKKQEVDLKNAVFVAVQGTPVQQQKAIDAIKEFNTRWPEVAITSAELVNYIRTRARGMNKTDYERAAGRKFSPLLQQPTAP